MRRAGIAGAPLSYQPAFTRPVMPGVRTIDRVEHEADRPVLAVDLGGTQIRAALITPDLEVHCRRAVATDDEEGVDAVLARIADLARAVREDALAKGLRAAGGI